MYDHPNSPLDVTTDPRSPDGMTILAIMREAERARSLAAFRQLRRLGTGLARLFGAGHPVAPAIAPVDCKPRSAAV